MHEDGETSGDVRGAAETATGSSFSGRSPSAEVIGPYTLLELIGIGGMGQVWLAEQKEPVRRRVAVKLTRSVTDTADVVARFESERQALALMDHPNIAKVFDGGSTPDGRPYFVMEYVAGSPITAYCDKHRLTTRQRMELFIQVCEGVQHAHQKAIIHRDLKPSNILVSEVNGKPMPRIIDFGVAKATSQRLTDQTIYTRVGTVIGTLEYMSPEQADSAGQDIDTRTDVYSLGVILYELLVGALPLDFKKLPFDQALKLLREEEPPKPSTMLRTRSDTSTKTAENRGADPPALTRQLQGDPDSIVLKAVEKDRSRRYSAPLELSADLQRYLRNEPVMARPASTTYRVKKYAQRHKGLVAGAAAVFIVLLAGIIASTWEARRALTAAAVAQATSDFLENDLLAQADNTRQSGPDTKPDPALRVRTVLDRAAAKIEGKFNQQPEVEASIRTTIGRAYESLGVYPEARRQLERALELRRRVLGNENPQTLVTARYLGVVALDQDKYAEAEALDSQVVEIARRVLGPEHPDTLRAMKDLTASYIRQRKFAEAEALNSQVVEIARRVLGPEHPDTLRAIGDLAVVYYYQGKYAQAEALYIQVVEVERRVLGPEHPHTLRAMNNLGTVYLVQDKKAQAEDIFNQALEIRRRVLGPEHPDTLYSMVCLADVYLGQGKYAQAEPIYIQVVEIERRVLGPEHPDTLSAMHGLATVYDNQGKYAQAEPLFRQVVGSERRVLGPEHPNTLTAINNLGEVSQHLGKYDAAETYVAQALAGRRHTLGADNPDTAVSAADLALAYLSQGKFAEGEPLAREAVETNRKIQPDDWQRYYDESLLGACLAGQKKYAEAEPLLISGYQGMVARKDRILAASDRDELDSTGERIVRLYQASGKPEKAKEWREKLKAAPH
ncbi:MAG: tetratricopeptide repeat protein [Capsulimonadaceae bacterium]